ncbi:hypothetical protein LIER_13005 [Lithospermum erythrorhizon]|uniref:Uncharacterized protein n=1 Tax=Lithospermum erythrorhizon TaxID=34254 RepID=A0AAV3PU24_LITER
MAIPQDVAESIARSLNDAHGEESLPTTEVFSVQPLAVRNPETVPTNPASTTSSTPAAPPTTHGAGASQTGMSAVNTAQRCVEPKDVPFSTMVGECRPLFRKSKVRKVPIAAIAATSTSNAEKRRAPEEGGPRLFSPHKKHTAQRPKQVEHVTISEDPPSTYPLPPAPVDNVNPPSPVSKEKKEAQEQCINEAKKLELLHSHHTRVEAEMMADFSKKRADETAQKLKAVEEAVPGQIEKAIRGYQFSKDFRREAGKDAAYCLCRFTRTYKEVNPAIVDNYCEFIQGYDKEWFTNCNLDAPLRI